MHMCAPTIWRRRGRHRMHTPIGRRVHPTACVWYILHASETGTMHMCAPTIWCRLQAAQMHTPIGRRVHPTACVWYILHAIGTSKSIWEIVLRPAARLSGASRYALFCAKRPSVAVLAGLLGHILYPLRGHANITQRVIL